MTTDAELLKQYIGMLQNVREDEDFFRINLRNILKHEFEKGKDEAMAEVLKIIDNLENPYPKDVFRWDTKEQADFTRGRFNQHCFEIVENMRSMFKQQLADKKVKA